MPNSFSAQASLKVQDTTYTIFRLDAVTQTTIEPREIDSSAAGGPLRPAQDAFPARRSPPGP